MISMIALLKVFRVNKGKEYVRGVSYRSVLQWPMSKLVGTSCFECVTGCAKAGW